MQQDIRFRHEQERRQHFRIEATVGVQLGAASDIPAARTRLAQQARYREQLTQLDTDLGLLLVSLRREHPAAAQALDLLNRKLQLIASHAGADATQPASFTEVTASLSASGIAFPVQQNYPPGALLELNLALSPGGPHILTAVRVVECRPHGHGDCPFQLHLAYHQISHADQEILTRHILNLQAQKIRQQADRPTL